MNDLQIRLLIARLLSGPPPPAIADDESTIARLLAYANAHGVVPLLWSALQSQADCNAWPRRWVDACRARHRTQAIVELANGVEVAQVLNRLARAGVDALLLKGTALAYACYDDPTHRSREDTDLIVRADQRDRARHALESMGYRRVQGPAGKLVGYQCALHRRAASGLSHTIDLHWRISDRQAFARLLAFDDLRASAVAVPALGEHAARLGDAHSLVVSLLHRAANNIFVAPGHGDRLIWLYDNRVLAERMSETARREFQDHAARSQAGALLLDGLEATASVFPSPRLEGLIHDLRSTSAGAQGRALLQAGRLRREWIELQSLPSLRDRISYLGARIVPDREYMHERFPHLAAQPVLRLHAARWLRALRTIAGADKGSDRARPA